MHQNILTKNQHNLLPFIKQFSTNYYLVGGTAIALQIGHRKSIDFDLFTRGEIDFSFIERTVQHHDLEFKVRYQDKTQITGSIDGVQITFYNYPFAIKTPTKLENYIKMPNLLTLASMKAYALGRRAKWKDYVDMFFLLRDHFSLDDISSNTEEIFGTMFNRKLFREQLSYFGDVDYSEKVEFLGENVVSDEEVKTFLINVSTEKL